jgi:NADH:ubiquinone oxidoreductase subunit E
VHQYYYVIKYPLDVLLFFYQSLFFDRREVKDMTTAVDGKAMREELISFIEEQKKKPGPLMPIMQKAQSLFGALTIDVQELISEQLGIPMSDVYGVATFYGFLSTKAQGRNVIRICRSLPCYMKNGPMIIESVAKTIGIGPGETTADGAFSLELTNCIGACDQAPAMLVNDKVYGSLTPAKIADILTSYKEEMP